MTSSIANTCIDCSDPWTLAQFWSQVLGRPIGDEFGPGDDYVEIPLGSGQDLALQQVAEPKTVKNRMHLCLQPDQAREPEVERLVGVGATLLEDHRNPDGTGWAVLADPEGNEFCVLRSAAERARTS